MIHFLLVAVLAAFAGDVQAETVVYVTDLSIFTYLAPCAASAVAQNIRLQTLSSLCATDATGLQACVCSQQYDAVVAGMAASVSSSCGATATEDQASAQTVLDAYCTQSITPVFPTPTHPVSSYIYELPGYTDLAPCAQTGLSYAMLYNTYTYCPGDETALASCVCTKNANQARVSSSIISSVRDICSSNADDVASAAALFSAYCALGDGITSYPTASTADAANGGLVSYYITDLPQFAALPSCAGRAVYQAVSYQTWNYCADNGPQAMASCACLKSGISNTIARAMTSYARLFCSTSAGESLSSAAAVLDYYCSAASAEVTATGIKAVADASSTRASRTPDALASAKSSILSALAASSSSTRPPAASSLSPHDMIIVGTVVGSVGCVLIIAVIFLWLYIRGKKQNAAREAAEAEQKRQAAEVARVAQEAQVAATAEESRKEAAQAAAREAAADNDRITAVDGAPPPYDAGTYGEMFHVQKPS